MKLQLLIFTVLKYLVLASQDEGENKADHLNISETDGFPDYNVPDEYEDETSAPCSLTVPGFYSVGITISYFIVFVFSLLGNTVVFYVVCHMKRSRVSTDVYLMQLAVADLLFTLTLPFWAIDAHFGWIFGTFPCKLLSGFQEASVYSGVFLLACISVDRHIAIVRATSSLASHHLVVKVVCGAVWLVAGLLSLPVVIQRESLYVHELGFNICYENLTDESSNTWRVSIRVLRHTVGFFLPLMVMAFCYGWTMLTLYHTKNKHKHKAMRVILAVVFAFVLCWLPYNAIVLIDTLIRGGSIKVKTCEVLYRVEMVMNVTKVFAFMHCAVNPVLYAFIGQKFRNELLSALYKQGIISKRAQLAYRIGSASSAGSNKSRHTSTTIYS